MKIGHRFETLAPKRILYWTTIFGAQAKSQQLADCTGLTDRCVIDFNRDQINASDAVVFHGADIHSSPLPDQNTRRPQQIYVFHTMETPKNSRKNNVFIPPNFFNWSLTFLQESDAISKYGSFFISSQKAESRGFKIQSYYVQPKRITKKSRNGIFGLISNCYTDSKRELAFEELAKYINVTIGGKCGKTAELRDICPMGSFCLDIFEQYPFYIAVENTVCNDYITEKFWNRISVPSIPIITLLFQKRTFPPKSFIAMDDYKNPHEMANHLRALESNSTAYLEYFAWRQFGTWTTAPWNAPGYRNGICRVCELLWKQSDKNATDDLIPEKAIPDVWKWYEEKAQCENDEFVQKWISS
ncbi:unnamed protein product [Caenorhabditis angaria]|uniref:Fucosyltransferase n=1 Tax=Caenorhabditis angaria TaxID=860376 RepID=A0A9P1MZM5_9PELO|nr:unnamed protein product [Caenorhabditis angaria]